MRISLPEKMNPADLLQTLIIASWLAYITRVSNGLSAIIITYKKIQKVKRISKERQPHALFSNSIEIPDIASKDKGFLMNQFSDAELLFPVDSNFLPKYGVMFNDLGTLILGLKQTHLFVLVDIPVSENLKDIDINFPTCADWAGKNLSHW